MFILIQMQLLYLQSLTDIVQKLLCHIAWRINEVI